MHDNFTFVYDIEQSYFDRFNIDLIKSNFMNQIDHSIQLHGWSIKYSFKDDHCNFYSAHAHPGPSFTRYNIDGTKQTAWDLKLNKEEYMSYETLNRLLKESFNKGW